MYYLGAKPICLWNQFEKLEIYEKPSSFELFLMLLPLTCNF